MRLTNPTCPDHVMRAASSCDLVAHADGSLGSLGSLGINDQTTHQK